jgi:endonuclease-8
MPEGHTLHRLARLHQRRYAGQPVEVTSPQGRFAAGASLVDGKTLVRAQAHGKHLFHRYGRDLTVHVHLGLIGFFDESTLPVTPPIGQVRMRMVGAEYWTDLRGPNICEVITDGEVAAIHARLGADPLRKDADPDKAYTRISRSGMPIAVLLLDQKVIAGVGNVYRAEILFRHNVDPMRPGRTIDPTLWKEMWTDLVTLMRYGVRTGRIDTVRPEHEPRVTGRAPRKDRHGGEVYVYRRTGEPCLVCGTPVASTELAGRNLYWCPTCQPT